MWLPGFAQPAWRQVRWGRNSSYRPRKKSNTEPARNPQLLQPCGLLGDEPAASRHIPKAAKIPTPPRVGVGWRCQRSSRGRATRPRRKLNRRTIGIKSRLSRRAMKKGSRYLMACLPIAGSAIQTARVDHSGRQPAPVWRIQAPFPS